MKKEDVKKGRVVIHIGLARPFMKSLDDISGAVEITAYGTDWCYHNQRVVIGPLPNRLCGIVGKTMRINAAGKNVPNPNSSLIIYPVKDMVTVPVFLKRCRELRVEYDKQQALIQKENETRAALASRLKKVLGFNVELDGTSVNFENLGQIEAIAEALELYCADTLHALFGSKPPKHTGK